MDIFFAILTVVGLIIFEAVSSFDNAVINAEILRKMSPWARRWFLIWGLFIAVFLIRGLLPLLIVFATNPAIGLEGAFTAALSSDPSVAEAVEKSAPILLVGGGIFLVFIFFHWLFLEKKNFGIRGEAFAERQGVWFYAVVSVILAIVTWESLQINPIMAFSAVLGSTAFFIVHGFRANAEAKEKEMLEGSSKMSDWSKILYLEVIDASFSIDGVVGAFAFTMSVPLILLGNGIGAFIVREMTIRNVENIQKYKYLKNGAMYSILILGAIMILDAFGAHIPQWLSPVATIGIIGYFLWKSINEIKKSQAPSKA